MLIVKILLNLLLIWALLELIVRFMAEKGVRTDFYGSISRSEAQRLQQQFGLKIVQGPGWFHLGWVADPEREYYRVQQKTGGGQWEMLAEVRYGSWLGDKTQGTFRVIAVAREDGMERELGTAAVELPSVSIESSPPARPFIDGPWQVLFKPERAGNYLNDHCLYRDAKGDWRLLGITSHSQGDYRREHRFAVGVGESFPPQAPFREDAPVADVGELAWAPEVVHDGTQYHLFWSPHQLYHTTSKGGIQWAHPAVVIDKPFHKFFRDAKIVEVALGQWLLYASGRGRWFSRVDIYQSFDLVHWQYIRPALVGGWGSEKNFVTGSMESPFLIRRDGRYYLSITYNNESFFWSALLLQFGIFFNRRAYNNTLIFQAESPYDFGVYRGKKKAAAYLTQLQTHAPIYVEADGCWYVTTCGWPFAATLSHGEVAFARLGWRGK